MRKRIGEFLVSKGIITEAQIPEILRYGRENGLRFGEAGLELGLITREKMIKVFGPSFSVDFFHLEARYFPQITKDLLPVELMLRSGALPLGFKTEHKLFRAKKILNLGMLDPASGDGAATEILKVATERLGAGTVQGTKVFLVLADQFIQVMQDVYGLNDEELRARGPEALDHTLSVFLDTEA